MSSFQFPCKDNYLIIDLNSGKLMNDAMLDLLKILRDKGNLTADECNLLVVVQLSGISPNKPFMNGGPGARQLALRFIANYATVLDFKRSGNAADGLEPAAFSLRSQVYW